MAATVQLRVIESSFDQGERLQAPGSLWLTYSIGFFMNFELLPMLNDYAN